MGDNQKEIIGDEAFGSDQNSKEDIKFTYRKLREHQHFSNDKNENNLETMMKSATKTLTNAFEVETSNQQRLIAVSQSYLSLLSSTEDHIYIPYPIIANIEKVHQRFGDTKVIEIQCKDFRSVYFSFKNSTSSVSDFIDVLRIYFPMKLEELFAFKFYESLYKLSERNQLPMTTIEGWNVPKSITESDLIRIKEYRSKGFPTLSWRNPEKGNTLTRSSQPRVGRNSRCPEDEKLLFEINICNQRERRILPSSSALSASSSTEVNIVLPLCVMDARPKSDALASIAASSSFDSINRFLSHFLLF
jgi:hypothetical protein